MISLLKQIIACLMIATLIAVACYFLPFVNGLFGDYLIGFFIAALVLPIGLKWYEAHMAKVRAMSQPVRSEREKERKEWRQKHGDESTGSNCYDQRNIDRQLHIFDGVKD